MPAILLIMVCAAFAAFIFWQNNDKQRVRILYKKLLRKTMGNKEQVERLIELERQRNPTASLSVLMQNAINRWDRDNR
ncbi:MAG: hypothetical protein AB1489_06665 [Acidobacteriota bacterium]